MLNQKKKNSLILISWIFIYIIQMVLIFLIKEIDLLAYIYIILYLISIIVYDFILGNWRKKIYRYLKEKQQVSVTYKKIYYEVFPYGLYSYFKGLHNLLRSKYLMERGIQDKYLTNLIEKMKIKVKLMKFYFVIELFIILLCIFIKIILKI